MKRSVLIVDQSEDSRETLRLVLRKRGVQTFEADEGLSGLQMARNHSPDVIVLDVDEIGDDLDLYEEFAGHAEQDCASLVAIGTARVSKTRSPGEFVAKPYQYGPLIRKIGELLAESQRVPNSDNVCDAA